MTVSTAEPPVEHMVACANNYPACSLFGGGMIAKRASDCACHVAREAVAHLLPKVTLKEPA
jgi:hypothetical protein